MSQYQKSVWLIGRPINRSTSTENRSMKLPGLIHHTIFASIEQLQKLAVTPSDELSTRTNRQHSEREGSLWLIAGREARGGGSFLAEARLWVAAGLLPGREPASRSAGHRAWGWKSPETRLGVMGGTERTDAALPNFRQLPGEGGWWQKERRRSRGASERSKVHSSRACLSFSLTGAGGGGTIQWQWQF